MTHTDANQLEMMGSRQFNSWLKEQRISLVFTTYQAGKIFLIGLQPDGRLSIFERTFNRRMSSLYQLWRLENALSDRQIHQGYDRLYVPQIGYTTGDLDIHDVAIDSEGKVLFVNTLFSCLATVSQQHSFIPLWKPPFISKLAAEDRCHLNGLAMENGQPRYLSAIAKTDVADGWRDRRRDGGCIIDVKTNEIVVNGLSMPHSPRVYKNRLWVLNSGTGYLGTIDLKKQKFEPLTFCPGYLRGLAFVDNFAVVGLSQPRENKTFSGLPLDDNLQAKNAEARCGLMVIEINTGDIIHWLRITGIVRELYDVAILPGVSRPMALGFKSEEIRRNITIG
jgi:uncharacterized protein (TIGR03032 family)